MDQFNLGFERMSIGNAPTFDHGQPKTLANFKSALDALWPEKLDLLQADIDYLALYLEKLQEMSVSTVERAKKLKTYYYDVLNGLGQQVDNNLLSFVYAELDGIYQATDWIKNRLTYDLQNAPCKFKITNFICDGDTDPNDDSVGDEFYNDNRQTIMAAAYVAVKRCCDVREIPDAIVTELKWMFGQYSWHAWIEQGGSFSWAYAHGTLDNGYHFGLFYTDTDPPQINHQALVELLQRKIEEHRLDPNPSESIDNETDDPSGPTICVHGKPGTVFVACSNGMQQVAKWNDGEIMEYALWRHSVP